MNDISSLIKKIDDSVVEQGSSFIDSYNKLVELKSRISSDEQKEAFNKALKKLLYEEKKETLFPNAVPEKKFAIPSNFSDTYSTLLNRINLNEIRLSDSLVKIGDSRKTISLKLDKNSEVGLLFENQSISSFGETSLEDSLNHIKSIMQDGTILQHYCALWNYALNYEKSFRFYCVKIDSVLATFLKKPTDGYFRQSTRQAFTKSIRTLQTIKMRIALSGTSSGKKSTEYMNIPLLDFSLSTENKDGSVILRLIGSMLGGNELNKRGRVFPEGIFELDPRVESSRITLVFKLATRFDQVNQNSIKWTRKKLIESSGLVKSDIKNKKQASFYLQKTLDRLKETACIKDYYGNVLSTNDDEELEILSVG